MVCELEKTRTMALGIAAPVEWEDGPTWALGAALRI